MHSYKKLIDGHKKFRKEYFSEEEFKDYRGSGSKQQRPRVMVISCSDSRINPAILTDSTLGDLFVVSNVANIVPPYKETCNTHHSTSSAIEFAVKHLKVKHIIVMGHSCCGGVNAMYTMEDKCEESSKEFSFISPWVDIISKVKNEVKQQIPDGTLEEKLCMCEKKSVLVSMDNLMSFPFVKSAVDDTSLILHGWYFDIEKAALYEYSKECDSFELIN
jgi:carbonic anhydrase